MKIISKFKDYYDHEIAHFGYDDSRVYDRRSTDDYKPINDLSTNVLFAICGRFVPVVKQNGQFVFNAHECVKRYDKDFIDDFKYRDGGGYPTKANEFYRQPVLVLEKYWRDSWMERDWQKKYYIPVLKDWGIPKIYDSRTMYSMIYDFMGWLKDNPEQPDNQTDKEKVISHGFDAKRSFRPKMKTV